MMNNTKSNLLKSLINDIDDVGSFCVYVHKNKNGEIFYVAIDKVDRSWSIKRPFYWQEYIESELKNNYSEEILKTNISEPSALEIKNRVLELYADDLINTVNFNRTFNLEIFEIYRKALDEHTNLLNQAIQLEKTNIDEAIQTYLKSYDLYIQAMNSRNYDANEKYLKAHSPPPPTKLVERLSMCMLKKEMYQQLIDCESRYSCYFTRTQRTGGELKFFSRVSKAKENIK